MRASILLAKVRGEDAWEFVCGPDTPPHEQREIFKEAKSLPTHPRWERVELWDRPPNADFVKIKAPEPAPDVVLNLEPAPVAPVIPAGVSVPPGTVVTEVTAPAPVAPAAVAEPAPVAPADPEHAPVIDGDPAEDFGVEPKGKKAKGK